MKNSLEFGELANDENLKKKILDLTKHVKKAGDMMTKFFSLYNYDELSVEDKIRYDLFVAFVMNTYFWIYLRIKGVDPNQHDIKLQINRVREYMAKSKKIYERKTIMPRVNQAAAKRFVRNGLWTPNLAPSTSQSNIQNDAESEFVRPNKRKKIAEENL